MPLTYLVNAKSMLCSLYTNTFPQANDSKVLRSKWSTISHPNAILSRWPDSVRVAIRRRRSVGICRIFRHRTVILKPLAMHELRIGVLLGAPRRREQIHEEGEYVESEDEGNDPFEDGRDVLPAVEGGGGKDGGEDDLHDDEEELEPEGKAQDAMLAEMHAEALVLGADEDGADDVAGHEEEEEAIV